MYLNLHPAEFFTATNLNWLPVLQKEQHKKILIEALQKRTSENQLTVYAFVIMPNHFHSIWRVHDNINRQNFQRDLMKFTARSILKYMQMTEDPLLQELNVNASDRKYQVWERNALSIELHSAEVFMQKLNYIHNNPLQPKWQLSKTPKSIYIVAQIFMKAAGRMIHLIFCPILRIRPYCCWSGDQQRRCSLYLKQ